MAFLSIHSSPLGQAGARDTGGMSTYLRGLSHALGQAGYHVDLFTRAGSPEMEEVRNISPNVRIVHLCGELARLDKNELYPYCPQIADKINDFCRREGITYQVIFSHYWLSGSVGRFLQHNWQVPHLVMYHTLGRAKNELCADESETLLRMEEEEVLAYTADRIIVAAKQEKERILGYYDLPADRIKVIPAGIDRTLFRIGDRKKAKRQLGLGAKNIILFVGRIEPVKGLDLLLRAVARLPAEDNFLLLIVGGDEQSRALRDQLNKDAAELCIADKVVFKGIIGHEQIPLYYNAADVTVMPSFYESFGLAALESVACGTPIVAGPVGIIPELINLESQGLPGYLVVDRSPASWAQAIRLALSQPKPISLAVIDSSLSPFNWTAIASQVAAECRSLIKQVS